jgi:K+/H+ antiporter YhaU regulatory subunit KhtT
VATPGADFQLDAGDVLVVVGQPQQIKDACQLLTGAVPA